MCPTVATHFQFSNNKKITQNKENMHILEKENKILSFFFFLMVRIKHLLCFHAHVQLLGKEWKARERLTFLHFLMGLVSKKVVRPMTLTFTL